MKPVFEYSDTLNNPYEAFLFDAQHCPFPILPHWHYFMEIILMYKGSAYIETEHENYVLEPGDLILFHPQAVHAIYSTGHFPLQYYVLKFDPVHLNLANSTLPAVSTLLNMAEQSKDLSIFFSRKHLESFPVANLFFQLTKVVTEKNFGYDIMAHSYCCLLITELFRLWKEEGFQVLPRQKKQSSNEIFSEIAEYLFQNYQKPLSIEEIAHHFHMSYSHFSMRFKEYYGQTCSHFIQMIRLQKAEDLLRFTDFDLSYISQETGFCDCSHFIRLFKIHYGITPKQFRRQQQKSPCISPK